MEMPEQHGEERSWSAFVRRVTGGATQVDIAKRAGLAQTNVGRWLRGDPGAPRADSVIAFARAFNEDPVEALIAAGYLENAELTGSGPRTPLSQYSDEEITHELQSRLRDRRTPDM
jgi:transcriptional regulator with XRE-family HTH domain